MPIIVNTNMSSINAQRSLFSIDRALNRAMERLSSGLRINRSADDAAGLAIATGMQTQVRGLNMAVRNVGDGLSAIGTADGAVNTQVELLQRIRELAVQAASGLNSSSNLKQIQTEIDEQISELTRVGNTATFNGKNLINGTFQNINIQVGANANQSISLSIGDFRATGMGSFAEKVGATAVLTAASNIDGTDVGATSLLINDVVIGTPSADGVSSHLDTYSGIAKSDAINAISGQTGVSASVSAASLTGTTVIAAATAAAADNLTINGVTIMDFDSGDTLITTLSDGTGSLRALINAQTSQTGVVASIDAATGKVILSAADGRNIIVEAAGAAQTLVGFTDNAVVTNAIPATHSATGDITLTSNEAIKVTAGATVQIGIASGTYTVDLTKKVSTVDVTLTGGPTDAIRIIDAALATIGNAQAKLGGIMNRLENTIDNLNVSIENITASESRIRDADFAKETANLVRAQIIQQAGVAILAQANLRPQAALALLG